MKDKISIIGQCFNEHEMLPIYYDAMCKVMNRMTEVDFELIFVDDNSRDDSLAIIKKIAEKDPRVKCISMSRNFGKAACCIAGLSYAQGDYVVTMDIDIQDPPHLLPEMLKTIRNEDVDIVATVATTRSGYSPFHKFCTKMFYKIFNSLSSVKIIDGQRDYRMMTRQVVDAILEHKEYNLFDKGYFTDVGFRTKWIEFENEERPAGETKWPFHRLMKFSIVGIIGYSVIPLQMILYAGIAELSVAAILLIVSLVMSICGSVSVLPCLIAAVILLLFSGQTLFTGILALYVAQIHTEVKGRPRFIVRAWVNLEKTSDQKNF